MSSRLTTNAGASATSTQLFFSDLPTAKAVASVASSVCSARTTSSSGQDRHRVEEVQADDPLRVLELRRHLGHRQRRGVGGQHALGRDDRLDLGEHLLLDRHLLEHRLDDEVGVGEDVLGQRAGDQALEPVELVAGTAGRAAASLSSSPCTYADALVDARLVDVGEDDGHLQLAHEQQRQLRRHEARADDADLGDLPGQRPCPARRPGAWPACSPGRTSRGRPAARRSSAGRPGRRPRPPSRR